MRGPRGWSLVGWLAVVAVLAWFQGNAALTSLRHTLKGYRINGDAQQQIFPFFKYVESSASAFASDYVADYYLACYPLGYFGFYATLARLGIDPTDVSRYLPHVLWLITVVCIGAAAYKLGGKLAALAAMALVLGCNAYLSRIAGGLPRSFGFPILAAALMALAYARVWWCAACVVVGALFYPVAAVISGLGLAGMVLLAKFVGSEARAWTWRRRLGFLAGVAALAAVLLLPSTLSSGRYGGVVRPTDTEEFPEAGRGGRYDKDSRAPFHGFFDALSTPVNAALFATENPWSEAAYAWREGGRAGRYSERTSVLKGALFILVLLGGAALLVRRRAARRVLLLAVASGVGHTIARFVVPYAYLPERYVAYTVPLMSVLAVSTCVAGFFPSSFDEGRRRWVKVASIGGYLAILLVLLGGRVTPNIGVHIDLRKKRPLFEYIAALPPDALVAGWPKGTMNRVSYASRRRAFVTHETHQAFHVDFVMEMRRRMRGLVDAYFATSVDPLIRLRDEFGVTHLLVERSHFGRHPPKYFKPFDAWISDRQRKARGKDFEIPKQLRAARVFTYRDSVLLDLSRIEPRPERERSSDP